jgi:hypothetical protein
LWSLFEGATAPFRDQQQHYNNCQEAQMNRIALLVFGCVLWGGVLGTALAHGPEDTDARVDDGSDVNAAAVARRAPAPATRRRYLVTYVKSRTDAPRSATVITVINRSSVACEVKVDWLQGFQPEDPVCTTTAVIHSLVAHDFCSRDLLDNLTTCNSVCAPEGRFVEGSALIFSSSGKACDQLEVDVRVYYTTGETTDTGVAAVSNPKIVRETGGEATRGD